MNHDPDLDAAFAAFRAGAMPRIKPDGIDSARATVRNRRQTRAVVLAAAAVIVVIVSVSISAGLGRSATPHPPAVGSSTPVDTTSPSPSAAPPSHPPSQPREVCGGPSSGAVPPGGIALAELCDATLTIPGWTGSAACPAGEMRFTNGARPLGDSFALNLGAGTLASDTDLAYADVDRDGDSETLLLVSCGGERWVSQVLALKRGDGDAITTMGRVVSTSAAIMRLVTVAAGPDGTVQVEVADWRGGLGDDGDFAQRQVRAYGWDGRRFVQTAGPTGFPVNPRVTDLAISTTDLAFGPPNSGHRSGIITITVRNAGPSEAAYSVLVQVPGFAQLDPVPTACTTESFPQPVIAITCSAAALAPGATRTHELSFRAPANADQTELELVPGVGVRIADGHGDPVPTNDGTDVTVTFA
jgi:hypothetical protein